MSKKEKVTKKTTTVTTTTTTVETKSSQVDYTHIICILDRSGSMGSIIGDAIGGFNEYINKQKQLPGKATVTTVLFDDYYDVIYNNVDIKEVENITRDVWSPRGTTALNDAIGKTINSEMINIKKLAKKDRPNKVLVVIVTDGHENASREYKGSDIKTMITEQEKNDWQFIYIGADQDAFSVGTNLGFSGGNTLKYSNTSIGNQTMFASVSDATAKYRSLSRSVDNVSYSAEVSNLFDGNTDISDENIVIGTDLAADGIDMSSTSITYNNGDNFTISVNSTGEYELDNNTDDNSEE